MWLPDRAEELDDALRAGTIRESHVSDFKRELGWGKSANKSLAIDIASLAVDGGVIFIGVDEDHDPPTLYPTDLTGLAERVEQVARGGAIDPPLSVVTRQLMMEPGAGVLLILVPASASAPHQVDGRYRGRADKINIVLSAAEVVRILDSRTRDRTRVASLLDPIEEADPVTERLPRLYAALEPSVRSAGRLLYAIEGGLNEWIRGRLLSGNGALARPLDQSLSPDFSDGIHIEPRPDGYGVAIGRAAPEPWAGGRPRGQKGALDLEVTEDAVWSRPLQQRHDHERDVHVQ